MAAIEAETCWWENYEKYNINVEMHFVGYLYIMDLINARRMEHIKTATPIFT